MLIAIEPTATLGIAACLWKVATESLFIVAGARVWEFIERGGSYFAPLVMGLWLWWMKRAQRSAHPRTGSLTVAMRVVLLAGLGLRAGRRH